MFVPFRTLANPIFARRFLYVAPRINEPELKIDGYPEFASTADTLPKEDRDKLEKLAKQIVDSHKTTSPIISFTVHGHADHTLREPEETSARTEQEVSEERAFNGDAALTEAIEKQPGGKDVLAKMVKTRPQGFGSKFREVVPARTEAEMRRNRRIEIFISRTSLPPPPAPQPPPRPTPRPPEPGTVWRIQIKNGTVTTVGIPGTDTFGVSSITFLINVEITDVLRKQRALFQVRATGAALPGVSMFPAGISTSSMTEGDPTSFTSVASTGLALFEGDVEISQDPGLSVSVLSRGGNINFLNFQRVNTKPATLSVANGSSLDTVPQASLGGVAKGSMKMLKSIAPAK